MSERDESTTVRAEVVVPVAPDLAFEVFVERIDAWWPGHRLSDEPAAAFVLEPGPQGRWYERTASGEECEWGRVLRWEPPHRVTLEWAIDAAWRPDRDRASEVDVVFVRVDGGTRVTLEHRHLDRDGDGWRDMRAAVTGPAGWQAILDRYRGVVGSAVDVS